MVAIEYWPTQGWKTSTPERQGMDSEPLVRLLEFVQETRLNLHSLLVIRHGYLVMEAYFYPFQPDLKHGLESCTKSVTAALIGVAIREGLIRGVHQPVLDFFPGRRMAARDRWKETMTLRHLLAMTSGLDWRESLPYSSNQNTLTQMYQSHDWVQFVLDRPMAAEPGAQFTYNGGDSHLLSAILQQATGMSTLSFAQARLFQPLGIAEVCWPTDPQGITIGEGELELTPRDMAKFGYLYLRGGIWEGQPVVPTEWVSASVERHSEAEAHRGYGYQWWILPTRGYTALGWGGQYIWVLPEQDLVVVATGGLEDTLPEQLVERFILPAVTASDALPENTQGCERLVVRSQAAAQAEPKPVPPLPQRAKDISGKRFVLAANASDWRAFSLSFPDTEARLTLWIGERRLEWTVGLDDVFRLTPGQGRPTPTSPVEQHGLVAMKGFWQGDHTFITSEQVLGKADGVEVRYTFHRERVDIRLRRFIEGDVEYLSGALQQ
jgi:CubicO group peptidase (beta-lactamase class C family)